MLRRTHAGITLCALAMLVLAPAARAGKYPNDRNGLVIGFGVGGGSAGIQDGDEREGGGCGNFRIGYAVEPDLVIAFEGSGWTKTFSDPAGDLTWTLSTGTAALTYYPGGAGGFLRGGIGFGAASVEQDFGGLKLTHDESGFGLLVAGGYEWRLTRKFALGPQVEWSYMDLDEIGNANVVSGVLDFDWYW